MRQYTEQVRLSVLVAVHNQARSIRSLLDGIITGVEEPSLEVIIVDDASRDQSSEIVKAFIKDHPEKRVRLVEQPSALGRGAAIRTALEHTDSEFCLVHNANVTCEYAALLAPLLAEETDVALGSRFLKAVKRVPQRFWQAMSDRVVASLCGMAAGIAFAEATNGLLAFRTSLARSVPLKTEGVGIELELLIQFAKRHARFLEIPSDHDGAGASIDILTALEVVLRTRFFSPAHIDPAADMLVTMSRARNFNRWMADLILPWMAGEVLELGAGIGNLTLLLAQAGASYTATDTCREHLYELNARAGNQSHIKLDVCNFSDEREMMAYDRTADTVICLNSLEHVVDDRAALANIFYALKPSGVAVILVPHGPQAFGSMDEVLGHQRRYTREELQTKMQETGFQLQRIIYFNRATWPGWYLNSKLLRRRTLSHGQLWLFDRMVPLLRRIDKRLPWPATSLIAIGVVPE